MSQRPLLREPCTLHGFVTPLRPQSRPSPRPTSTCRASTSTAGSTAMEGERRESSAAASTSSPPASAPLSRSFLRPHLLSLAPYTPIEPFEILSARLGRSTDDIIKLDANENPYGPPPEVGLVHVSIPVTNSQMSRLPENVPSSPYISDHIR